MDNHPLSGKDRHIFDQQQKAKQKAGKEKESLLGSIEKLRDVLTLGDDPRLVNLEKVWRTSQTISQQGMIQSYNTNEVFSARGFFGAYSIVLDWRNDIKNKIKALNGQIYALDAVINPIEGGTVEGNVMDTDDTTPAH